jgi:hypothetical protein
VKQQDFSKSDIDLQGTPESFFSTVLMDLPFGAATCAPDLNVTSSTGLTIPVNAGTLSKYLRTWCSCNTSASSNVNLQTTGWVPLWNPMSSMALQAAAKSQKMKPFPGSDYTSKPCEHQLDHLSKYKHDTHLEGIPPLNAPLNTMSAFVFKIAFVLVKGLALAAS